MDLTVTVPATNTVRAALGDWLLRDLLPLRLYAAELDQDAVACRALPQVVPEPLGRPGKLRPLATAASQAHQRAEKRWTEAWNSAPRRSFRSGIEVCRDVLGSDVLNTANTARACFPRSRVGYFAYAALFGCMSAAELALDEAALHAVRERSDRRPGYRRAAALIRG
jgi:hypothetical protein